MFYGMSSVKEYWKRARSTARSEFDTTASSDYSFEDSNSSCSKEYRDASCNVDFDDDKDFIDDDILPNVTNKLTDDFRQLTVLTENNNGRIKLSRYVRWNILMSLGIGLWLVLCIVDLLHSEKSITREWLYVYILGRKASSKMEIPKKLETPVFWYSSVWPYVWKFVTLTTSGGAYALLFVLMIVFCADPRLRNGGDRSSSINSVVSKSAASKASKNSIVDKKSLMIKKISPFRHCETKIPKSVFVRLELSAALDLQRKFFPSIEKRVRDDLRKFNEATNVDHFRSRETGVVKVFHDSNNRENQSTLCFSINGDVVELFDGKNRETLQITGMENIDFSTIGKIDAAVKDTVSLCLLETRKTDLNIKAPRLSTFDLEIGEYLRKTRRSSRSVFHEIPHERNCKNRRNFVNVRPEVTNFEKITKTRIITSSPAFKKFLSSFQKSGVS